MDAVPTARERWELADAAVVQIVIWQVPVPLAGSSHLYKYRLALVVDEVCVLRFDNEAGKGDHFHLGRRQSDYDFHGIDDLRVDFWTEVDRWMKQKRS